MFETRGWRKFLFFIGFLTFITVLSISCVRHDAPYVAVSLPPFGGLLQEILSPSMKVVELIKNPDALENTDISLKMLEAVTTAQVYFSFQLPLEKNLQNKNLFPENQWIRFDLITSLLSFQSTTDDSLVGSDAGALDPHFWMSPQRMQKCLQYAVKILSKKFPEYARDWQRNLVHVSHRLTHLGERLRALAKKDNHPSFLIFHPALGYLAKDYGFTQMALEREGKEISLKDFLRVLPLVKEKRVRVLYLQKGVPERLVKNLEKLGNIKTVMLDPFGNNYEKEIESFIQGLQ